MKHAQADTLSFFPLWRGLKRYHWRSFYSDIYAAFTIALLALPQSMAYALIADLPPSLGLFSAVFGTIFGAAFGSSKHLVMGVTNTVSILILSGTSEILYTYYHDVDAVARGAIAVQIVIELTLIVGLIQIIAA